MITLQRVLGVLTLAILVACGGGGGGSATSKDTYNLPLNLGHGAALAGATVTVDDSAKSTTFTCSGTTDENGYIMCNVPASYTPPFVITGTPVDSSATTLKTVVISPSNGTNAKLPVTPLTTLLLESDAEFYKTATLEQKKTRLEARKKQITDALTNVISQILGADKAKNYDFLSDSSFVPGSNTEMDLLLDNINVDTSKLEVSLKNDSTKKITLNTDSSATVTPIAQTDVSNNKVTPTKRELKDFVGTFPGTIKYTSYDYKGVAKGAQASRDGSMTFNANGTISETYGTSKWTGTFKLNDAGYSVKISGKITPTDNSGGGGTFVGSVDNKFKLSITYNTKAAGENPDTTRGYVTGTGSKQ